jgi:hypothetical protein
MIRVLISSLWFLWACNSSEPLSSPKSIKESQQLLGHGAISSEESIQRLGGDGVDYADGGTREQSQSATTGSGDGLDTAGGQGPSDGGGSEMSDGTTGGFDASADSADSADLGAADGSGDSSDSGGTVPGGTGDAAGTDTSGDGGILDGGADVSDGSDASGTTDSGIDNEGGAATGGDESSAEEAEIAAAKGNWFQADRKNCKTFCPTIGRVNRAAPSGDFCSSGEVIPRSAHGVISYTFGTWPHSRPHHYGRISKSEGQWCYQTTPRQKHDYDRTDKTVGCYCLPN